MNTKSNSFDEVYAEIFDLFTEEDGNQKFIFLSGKEACIYKKDNDGIDLIFDGKRHYSRVTLSNNNILVHMPFGDVMLQVKPRFKEPGTEKTIGGLVAPMPGKVIDIKVKKGKKVKAGETLVILEAMKMEHSIKAAEDGKVSELLISINDQVENGALLMVVK